MTDKVQKILAKIEFLLNETNYEPYSDEVLGRIKSLKELKSYIDSLQEEPVSEELEEEYLKYVNTHDGEWTRDDYIAFASHFANWQKHQIMKDAVEATVHGVSGREGSTMKGIAVTAYADVPDCNFGDKVKVIVIKEN